MKRTLFFLAAVLLSFSWGCAGKQHYYAPERPTPLNPSGILGAMYAIPPDQEKSSVRIFPMELKKVNGERVLPVRFYFENFTKAPWKLDVRLQKIRIEGETDAISALNPSGSPKNPVVEIPMSVSRIVDVLFPVHSGFDRFEMTWQVTAGLKPEPQGTIAFKRDVLPDVPSTTSGGPTSGGRHH